MQISNSEVGEVSKCRIYSTVNHLWWMSMLFHRQDLAVSWLGCCCNIPAAYACPYGKTINQRASLENRRRESSGQQYFPNIEIISMSNSMEFKHSDFCLH